MINKILLVLLLIIPAVSKAQNTKTEWVEIPDAKFVAYLKGKIPGAFSDNKMNIHSYEVKTLTRINVINKKIVNFSGIEYFTNLEEFNCTYNLATELNLSKNTRLKYLVCWENRLTSLDLSGNPELLELNCGDNKITKLNVTQNKLLKHLYAEYNKLEKLDVSKNLNLEILNIVNNKITDLDLTQNKKITKLETIENPLSKVTGPVYLQNINDVNLRNALKKVIPNAFTGNLLNVNHTNVANLIELDLSSKDIEDLSILKYFKSLEKLSIKDNKVTTLDLSKNVFITQLEIDNNPLKSLDLRGVRYTNLLTQLSSFNQLTDLKLHANLRDMEEVIKLKSNRGKNLKISVFGASYGSADYTLINGNDSPISLDNKYRNNS